MSRFALNVSRFAPITFVSFKYFLLIFLFFLRISLFVPYTYRPSHTSTFVITHIYLPCHTYLTDRLLSSSLESRQSKTLYGFLNDTISPSSPPLSLPLSCLTPPFSLPLPLPHSNLLSLPHILFLI